MTPRGWVWPLLVAALIDVGLVLRFENSSGMAVDRAILRSVRGSNCQQAVLVHSPASDQLFVIDTWRRGGAIVSGTATADFVPGAGLTPQSKAAIAEGGEVNLTMLQHPVAVPAADGLLISRYQQQLDAAASWLAGPCLPFANPFQSHLRRVGTVVDGRRRLTLYRGALRYARGAFQLFAAARVWIGVRADGRMGFEVLQESPLPTGGTAGAQPVTVTTLFQYPDAHLGRRFARQPAALRAGFYEREYDRVLGTLRTLVTVGLRAPR